MQERDEEILGFNLQDKDLLEGHHHRLFEYMITNKQECEGDVIHSLGFLEDPGNEAPVMSRDPEVLEGYRHAIPRLDDEQQESNDKIVPMKTQYTGSSMSLLCALLV